MTQILKSCALAALLIGLIFNGSAQTSTHTYWNDTTDRLELDLYKSSAQSAPLMVFVHGGGFVGGSRKHTSYKSFFSELNNEGIDVVSIDYSKPLLGQKFHCDQPQANKLMAFGYAARDIRRATNWIVENDTVLGVTPSNIWLCGSSAGAEALLFQLFGDNEPSGNDLPVDFIYSGYISLAGATVELNSINILNAIPGLMIHGSCDALVPLGTAIHHYCPEDRPGALLLHGPESIAKRYDDLGANYQFILHCGAKHSIAMQAMKSNVSDIVQFIKSDGKVDQKRVVIGESEDCYFTGSDSCSDD